MSTAIRIYILQVISVLPVFSIILVYSFVVRARFILGEWPSYGRPDPKELGLYFHYGLGGNAYIVAAFSLPLFLIILFWCRKYLLEKRCKLFVGVYLISYLSLYVLVAFDPLLDWFFD